MGLDKRPSNRITRCLIQCNFLVSPFLFFVHLFTNKMDYTELVNQLPEIAKFTQADLVEILHDVPSLLFKLTTKMYISEDEYKTKTSMVKVQYDGQTGVRYQVKYFAKSTIIEEQLTPAELLDIVKQIDLDRITTEYKGFVVNGNGYEDYDKLTESDLEMYNGKSIMIKKVHVHLFSFIRL